MTDADNTDYQVFLANTHAQAEFFLNSLEQTVKGIVLYMNVDETEFICSKQDRAISLNSKPLKLEDQFTYLGSNISST